MANHKSSIKRIRTNSAKRTLNRYQHKTVRTMIKDIRALSDKKEATGKLSSVVSAIDKLAKKNIIHKNKASNLKSNLTRRVSKL